MSSVKVSGNASGTGEFTIAAPNSNTNRTLTLPDNTGTVVTTGSTAVVSQSMLASGVAGTGPAFAAKGSATQTFGSGTWTKLAFQTELFDTNSNYDNSTYRFTPTTAGYYQINFASAANETGAGGVTLNSSVYKNGAEYSVASARDTVGQPQNLSQGCVVSLNGSTDYVEIYGFISGGTFTIAASRMFSAALVRAA
jgi:hypothetical protein